MRSILKEKEHLSRQLRGIRDQGKRLLMILMKREFKKPFMLSMADQNDLTSLRIDKKRRYLF